MSKYWHAGKGKSRRTEMKGQIDASDDMNYRLDRRFGDQQSLMLAYCICTTNVQRKHLLCDLSTAGSNLRPDVVDREEFPIFTGELVEDSIVVAEAIANVASETQKNQSEDVVDIRQVYVKMDDTMKALLMPLDHFAEYFHFESTTGSKNCAFCEITIEAGSARAGSVRSSSPLFIALVPGMDMIELLCKAYDSVLASRRDSLSRFPSKDRGFHLAVVRKAVSMLEEAFPIEMQDRMKMTKQSNPQLLLLVENLGHGGSNISATARSVKEYNTKDRDNKVSPHENYNSF